MAATDARSTDGAAPAARAIAATLLVCSLAAPLPAQTPSLRAADSLVAVGDSAGALAVLDALVHREPANARAWHRRGMLAWARARKARGDGSGFISDGQAIRNLILADSSLRIAVLRAPDSSRFAIDLGEFNATSTHGTVRSSALRFFEQGVAAARRVGDSTALAEAADAAGLAHWRRYTSVAHKAAPGAALPSVGDPEGTGTSTTDLSDARMMATVVERAAPKRESGAWSGREEYDQAVALFGEAIRADPADPDAMRHLCMALADRERWEELRETTGRRLARAPWDATAWMARGLALHRLGDDSLAGPSFDSAFVLVGDTDRRRLTRLSRVLRESDSAAVSQKGARSQAALERLYWLLLDPLWTTSGNEVGLEFLARVTYAELLWTVDATGERGADTDRGELFIRYGPPSREIAFSQSESVAPVKLVWWYGDFAASFELRAGYGTAPLTLEDAERIRNIRHLLPARWSNVPITKRIDSATVRLARFRASPDSADVYVTARLPLAGIARATELRSLPLQTSFWLIAPNGTRIGRDSTREIIRVAGDSTPIRSWHSRGPAGALLYRVEAWQADAGRGVRGSGIVSTPDSAFRLAGFGMSDVVVGDSVTPHGGAVRRWRDFDVVPNVGQVKRGHPFGILWETYELAADSGSSRYRVSVSLEPVAKKGLSGLVARVVGGVAGAVGASGSGRDRVTLSYERQAPAQPATVDYLALDIGPAPPGDYTLRVEITDLTSLLRTEARTRVTIVE